jgi:hypothetical protein
MSAEASASIDPAKVAEFAVDLWRIRSRAASEGASERVVAACERAEDRMRRMGFETEMLEGAFDPNQRARVVDHEDADGPLSIAACLTPAVTFNGILVREAEIVTRGGGQSDG